MTDLRRIADAMCGEVAGDVAKFPTPGHGPKDRGSWASIVPGAPDGVLIHSGNGGDPLAIKDQLRAKGVLPPREQVQRNRDVMAWDYCDESGTVIYRKVRMALANGDKSFRFESPDGRGGWTKGRAADPVPYRLPDLTAAPKDALIYMAEGEKQADKLASWGLVATSSKDWRGFDFSGYVKGRTVAILPDNDEQGAKIAADAKAAVEKAGGTAFLVELPGLPPKGDIMDWRGDRAELERLADAAMHVPAETFELADLSLWATTAPTPKAFVMAPFIPREDVVIVTGDGGTNKSTMALQISACAAAGRQFLGMDVAPGPALYITAEDDNRENHWRLAKIATAIGTTLNDLAGRLHIVSLRGRMNNELATFEHDGTLRSTPAYALLRATIERTGAKLVTLDNVAHLFAGNENDRGQVTAFINLLYQLCGDLGVTILLIAHRNKSGDSYSGSTAWLNAVRSQVLLERSDEDDADVRRISLGKANYARAGEEVTCRWHDYALVRDSDLAPAMAKEIAANAQANRENEAFMHCLAVASEQHRAVSHNPGSNYAPKVFAVMPEGKKLNERAYRAAMERLLHLGKIELDQPLWRGPNRVMKQGIKAAEICTDPPAPTPRTNPHETRTSPARFNPPIPTVINGAATVAAAPLPKSDLSRVVFPADDVGDPNTWGDDE